MLSTRPDVLGEAYAPLTFLLHRDPNALAPSLDHRYEHVMVIEHVIFSGLKQGHMRKDSHSQGGNDEVDLAERQTGSVTGQ